MAVQTLRLQGKDFVLIPKREFDRIQAQAQRQARQDRQDAGDVAQAKRRAHEPIRPYAKLRAELGV